MKKTLSIIFFLFFLSSNAQTLNIDETISYLNENLKTFSKNKFQVQLKENGILKFKYINRTMELGNGRVIENGGNYEMYWSDVRIRENNFSPTKITFECKAKKEQRLSGFQGQADCIQINSTHSMMISFFSIEILGNQNIAKITNAFEYLLTLIENKENANNRDSDDPFAPNNYNKNGPTISGTSSTDDINLETNGGVYKVWVKIGNLNKHFVLDSGASEISLSTDTERELINSQIIKKEDYIEPALFKLADGSIIKCRRLIIPEMTIGNYKVKNVRASIGVSESPLLLGRSFLDNFKKWTIDNSKKQLHLEK